MSTLKKFPRNTAGRDFVVGDIHGCFDRLETAVAGLAFDEARDRLFSVGDLVDRGPFSDQALDWIAKPWFHPVRGNHDQMAIDVAAGRHDLANYLANGGDWFLLLPEARQQMIARVFDELPYLIEIDASYGRIGIVHAEIHGNSWDAFAAALDDPESPHIIRLRTIALWSRSRITHGEDGRIEDLAMLYVGHTPVTDPMELGNVRYIDTGAVYGCPLTVVQIDGPKT